MCSQVFYLYLYSQSEVYRVSNSVSVGLNPRSAKADISIFLGERKYVFSCFGPGYKDYVRFCIEYSNYELKPYANTLTIITLAGKGSRYDATTSATGRSSSRSSLASVKGYPFQKASNMSVVYVFKQFSLHSGISLPSSSFRRTC